jgi:hypothetical protein
MYKGTLLGPSGDRYNPGPKTGGGRLKGERRQSDLLVDGSSPPGRLFPNGSEGIAQNPKAVPTLDRRRIWSIFGRDCRPESAPRSTRRRKERRRRNEARDKPNSWLNFYHKLSKDVIICKLELVMGMNPEQRFRIRFALIAIILATLPCYCTGLFVAVVARRQASLPTLTLTPSPTQSMTISPTITATWTPFPTLSPTPTRPTLTPTQTATLFLTPTPTFTLPASNTPTLTPTFTFTATFPPPPPSPTWTATATATQMTLPTTTTASPSPTPSPTSGTPPSPYPDS